jgi:hypothetical protein
VAIHYSFFPEKEMLVVETSGYDENLEEVENYGLAILDQSIKLNCSKVLCNESNLEYRLGTLDTYKLAKFLALMVPHVAKAAIVCNEKFITDAHFWETAVVNRGLEVRVFNTTENARLWLLQNEKNLIP